MGMMLVEPDLLRRVEQFIFMEARLQDTHDYAGWEALWADDGIYWLPANGNDIDPEAKMSIIYDNRSRIGVRVRQLLSGKRYTQDPKSAIRHFITNVEVLGQDDDAVQVGCNVMVYESSLRGETTWAARTEYLLHPGVDGYRMSRKKVTLVNNDKPLFTLSFLI